MPFTFSWRRSDVLPIRTINLLASVPSLPIPIVAIIIVSFLLCSWTPIEVLCVVNWPCQRNVLIVLVLFVYSVVYQAFVVI